MSKDSFHEALATPRSNRVFSMEARIEDNRQIARDTWKLTIRCPEIAAEIAPGQFVMVRECGTQDPILGRPFAMYDVHASDRGQKDLLDVVYLVKGKLTSRLVRLGAGQSVYVWGPLGNGFHIPDCERLIMVAGGIGQTPFLAVAKESKGLAKFGSRVAPQIKETTLLFGARSKDFLAGVDDFEATGIRVRVCTDDGTAGPKGFVTTLLQEELASNRERVHVLSCGPEPMMAAVSRICEEANVSCDVSLETPMACGIGICFTCVAMIRDANGHCDYRRTCVEGPVFDASKVVW